MYKTIIRKQEFKTVGIVMIGTFAPAMFQPLWFGKNGILNEDDVNNIAKKETPNIAVLRDISTFETEQFYFNIQRERFEVIAQKEPFCTLRDAVCSILSCLPSTPISAFGINVSAHFELNSKKNYQKFGDILAPKSRWKTLLGKNITGEERKGGLLSLKMNIQEPDKKGSKTVLVEVSQKIKNNGVFLSLNDHFVCNEETSECAASLISKNFDSSDLFFDDVKKELFSDE